ncbi:serine hydrolase [Pseudorhodoferax sp. Leaf267]|uniref:serine hydrolase domain-containing protein n=1 Tax=Pseudorhodoferax sp. Leaf267 TaxID=1736316 RepID=UPI0006F3CC3F|nr:serine hydrolase domain-containing protein [Pseudorhodoferax sp. Leaf267]KQP22910.1 serine hydrolase [Pseudorhodoferax sp. Leaf267]
MEPWTRAALEYVPRWMEMQMRATERPGVSLAVNHRQRTVLELALGHADLPAGKRLTPRHRFRIASHSKSFTAAGILKLREAGLLQLDDPVGQHIAGLHPRLAEATLAQLLSHSAGTTRDGPDAGQFQDRRPFLGQRELMQQLAEAPPLEPNSRFKYSNHGFALLGQVIEALTGEAYGDWMQREILDAAGLRETLVDADADAACAKLLARGHSGKLLLGRRVVVPGDQSTHALAPAAGFVSTAADVASFYAQLLPDARRSVLSPASRREMLRRHWAVPHSSAPGWYGLGVMQGGHQGWDWVGHTGGFQGFVSRSLALPAQQLSISVLCNSIDGFSWQWMDGLVQILQTFERHGAPTAATRAWDGRFWSPWGPTDLVPMRDRVFAVSPSFGLPFTDATELTPHGKDRAVMSQANGYASFGEEVRLVRGAKGEIKELWLGGSRNVPEAMAARAMRKRYER